MTEMYTCAVCGKSYETVDERSKCESKCIVDRKKAEEETEKPNTPTDAPTVPEQDDNLPVVPDSTNPTLPPDEETESVTPTVPNNPEDTPSTPPEASEIPSNSPNEDIAPTESEDTPPAVQEDTEDIPTMPNNTEVNSPPNEEQGSMIETKPENEPSENSDTEQKVTNSSIESTKDETPEKTAPNTSAQNEPDLPAATESVLLEEQTKNNELGVADAYNSTTPSETESLAGNTLTPPEGAEAAQTGNREDNNHMSIVILVSILLALEVIQLGCIAIFLFVFIRSENIRKLFKHKYQR